MLQQITAISSEKIPDVVPRVSDYNEPQLENEWKRRANKSLSELIPSQTVEDI
jgi:hypothetical protein